MLKKRDDFDREMPCPFLLNLAVPARSNRKCITARRLICRRDAWIAVGADGSLATAALPGTRTSGKPTRSSTRSGARSMIACPRSSPNPDCPRSGSYAGQSAACSGPLPGIRFAT